MSIMKRLFNLPEWSLYPRHLSRFFREGLGAAVLICLISDIRVICSITGCIIVEICNCLIFEGCSQELGLQKSKD